MRLALLRLAPLRLALLRSKSSTLQPHFFGETLPSSTARKEDLLSFLEGWNVGLKGSSHVFQMSDGQTLRIP